MTIDVSNIGSELNFLDEIQSPQYPGYFFHQSSLQSNVGLLQPINKSSEIPSMISMYLKFSIHFCGILSEPLIRPNIFPVIVPVLSESPL